MLKFEGQERTTAEKALRHEYFSHASVMRGGYDGYHSPGSSGSNSPLSSSILDLSTSTDSGIQEA